MDQSDNIDAATRHLFVHMLYEYRKGVRILLMITVSSSSAQHLMADLEKESVDYYLHHVTESRVNLLFGRSVVIETIRAFLTKPLSHLSPEEDFILGTLLGYDREQQCHRFLARTKQ